MSAIYPTAEKPRMWYQVKGLQSQPQSVSNFCQDFGLDFSRFFVSLMHFLEFIFEIPAKTWPWLNFQNGLIPALAKIGSSQLLPPPKTQIRLCIINTVRFSNQNMQIRYLLLLTQLQDYICKLYWSVWLLKQSNEITYIKHCHWLIEHWQV